VFKLTPTDGRYSERVLWSLGKGGSASEHPIAALLSNATGTLFGTSQYDAFELAPSGKRYVARDIWNFCGPPDDGCNGTAPFISDASGALYSTMFQGGNATCGCGIVFKLSPSRSGYTETILHIFGAIGSLDGENPNAGVLAGPAGALYGTTVTGGQFGGGTVFRLTPYSGVYSERVLWDFGPFRGPDGSTPYGNVIADATGALYSTTAFGGTYGHGTVFRLRPSNKGDVEDILWSFGKGVDGIWPAAGLVAGPHGTLYGTTTSGGPFAHGTVFELMPSTSGYSERILWSFLGGHDGSHPQAALIFDARGTLYGTTVTGGAYGEGTVFALVP
jgi:uncharacterized repeat protein (TIGR03803 family)